VGEGEAEVGEGAGAGGDGRGGHRWPGRSGPFGSAIQLTCTVCGAEAGGSREMVALPLLAPRVTVTVSVTLCPAWSFPK
jgi:hypothetical protein